MIIGRGQGEWNCPATPGRRQDHIRYAGQSRSVDARARFSACIFPILPTPMTPMLMVLADTKLFLN